MTTNPTDQPQAAEGTPMSTWMSDATVAALQEKYVELVVAAKEYDELIVEARKAVVDAEQQLRMRQELAAGARKEIEETKILLAIAQGRAPRPAPAAVHADDMRLLFGSLRLAGPPDNPIRDDYAEHAALMRQVMAAALDIADRADKAAALAPRRRSTPDRRNPDGSTIVTAKRTCNGCGSELGDATEAELNASYEGRELPDVRDECPRCNGTAQQPVTGNGDVPIADQPHQPDAAPAAAAETFTDPVSPAEGGEGQ
ncbi:hypothetical protein [Actinoallomurus iriomotensis]|uniref:Uncharacterized protein n=1 Tax=Actinoallomurus iriomotensis TaxID=478107 RepID=A0A9W6RST3_9ACTN|nr:hypothetical protein [Actinoallomurus iriomotensis]GLY81881.1 hypothetical protein Airi01_101480 [Actinoallomurus iriomotensis]